jgi:transposase
MAKQLISDELWNEIQPLLPPPRPRRTRYPGRRPLDPRKVLTGIVFVLKSGIAWDELPVEMGCGSGMSCLNYIRAWQQAGVWPKLSEILRARLPDGERCDWARVTAGCPVEGTWDGGSSWPAQAMP